MQAGTLDTGSNGVDIGTTVTSVTVPHSPVTKRAGRRHIHTRVSGLSIITDSQTSCECFPAEGFHRTSVGHLNVVTTVRFATGGSRYASPLLVCRTATRCRPATSARPARIRNAAGKLSECFPMNQSTCRCSFPLRNSMDPVGERSTRDKQRLRFGNNTEVARIYVLFARIKGLNVSSSSPSLPPPPHPPPHPLWPSIRDNSDTTHFYVSWDLISFSCCVICLSLFRGSHHQTTVRIQPYRHRYNYT